MLVAYFIMKNCRNITRESSETVSLKWKRRSMWLNVISILLACYFFYRHNKYCEPLGELDIMRKTKRRSKLKTGFFYCSLLYVCVIRIRSCSVKYGISLNRSLGFREYASHAVRDWIQNNLRKRYTNLVCLHIPVKNLCVLNFSVYFNVQKYKGHY